MEVIQLKQVLDLITKGLAAVTTEMRVEMKDVPKEADRQIIHNLCLTAAQTNSNPETLAAAIEKTAAMKRNLLPEIHAVRILTEDALWDPQSPEEYAKKLQETEEKDSANEDAKCLRHLIIDGLKGVAAYVNAAYEIGYEDEGIDPFLQRVLQRTLKYNLSVGLLFNLSLEVGGYAYRAMGLLDRSLKNEFGEAKITNVELGVRKKPGILVAGQNIALVKHLLDAAAGTGVEIYTHGEVCSAHYYEAFRNVDHFAGNYGGSLVQQGMDFEAFNGPVIFSGSGLVAPMSSYGDRIYTYGVTELPGVPHLPDNTDFSEVIEQAKTCAAPKELVKGELVGGFNQSVLFNMAETLEMSLKDGSIKRLVAIVGTDGPNRGYYTELAAALPKTSAVLTAGSVRYRFSHLPMGTVRGMPRLMDCGQTADLYSIIATAMKFRADLDCYDVSGVPIIYHVALGSEQTVCQFLALVYVGCKGIYVGPEKPACMTEHVYEIFRKNFNLKDTGIAAEDVDAMFAEKEHTEGGINPDMLIIDIIEKYPDAAEVLMNCGMSCVTCGSALYESLTEACYVHGLDPEDVKEVLDHELGLVSDDE